MYMLPLFTMMANKQIPNKSEIISLMTGYPRRLLYTLFPLDFHANVCRAATVYLFGSRRMPMFAISISFQTKQKIEKTK